MPSVGLLASPALLSPVRLGVHTLPHRIVLALPSLSDEGNKLEVCAFYRERSVGGGLIITPPSPILGERTKFGKDITAAVHSQSGIVFLQLFHSCDDAKPTCDIADAYKSAALQAISNGFDGVEFNVAEGSILEQYIRSEESIEPAVDFVMDLLAPLISVIGPERIGVRMSPYSTSLGFTAKEPVLRYLTLLSRMHTTYPDLAYVHFVAGHTLGDVELPGAYSLDPFRAILSFPCDIGKTSPATVTTDHSPATTIFISSNNYTPVSALEVALRTGDLIAFSSHSLSNPDIPSIIRNGTKLQLNKAVAKKMSDIDALFRTGKEYIFGRTPDEHERTRRAMANVDEYLGYFDPALSYEGTDKQIVWRKSCWFACKGLGHPFMQTEEEIAPFDGIMKDGLLGLKALQIPELCTSLQYLRSMLDRSLILTARALGIKDDMILRCSVRYRIVKYVVHCGNPGGVGLHPDGNLLTAIITDGPGLKVYDFDGTLREPSYDGTLVSGGSTLYRWSNGTYPPTFHDVSTTEGQKKTSIVAFMNFPDMTTIPRRPDDTLGTSSGFFHDIKCIKEDDRSPKGELAPLWDVIIEKHKLVLPNQ